MAGYTNHYNQKLNKCFVRLNSTKASGNVLNTYTAVLDAFEGRQYAEYFGGIGDNAKPNVCTSTSDETKYCHSLQEFEALVMAYMEQ